MSRWKNKLRSYLKTPASFITMLLVMLSALITFTILLFLIAYILIKGIPHLTTDLFALKYTSDNGSLMPALLNTLFMTALSLIIAVPLGIFSAIFLVEYSGKGNKFVEVALQRRRYQEYLLLYMGCSVCCSLYRL